MTSAAGVLAKWAVALRPDDVPVPVRRTVVRHLADGLGCAVAAARAAEAVAAVEVASGLGGPAEASIVGGGVVSAPAAALANGALVHALDFDDTHGDALVHVTAAVLPAALAVAEAEGLSGEELVTACAAGFEAVTRLGAAARHAFHRRGLHATSVCGVFASALVAARLAGGDGREVANALGIAGSLAGGSLQFLADGSTTKQLHPGLAAHSGILAARLAAAGATGPAAILEGEHGLYRAYADTAVDAASLVAGLGDAWESTRITIKPYPVCQLSHASLDALLAADVAADEVESVEFRVPADAVAVVCEPAAAKAAPRSPYDAKFSLPWSAAALLLDCELTVETFRPEALERREVRELASRVRHVAYDPETSAANAGGHARVRLRGGGERVGTVAGSRGGPDAPLTDDELRAKLVANLGPGFDDATDTLLALDELSDVRAVGAVLRGRRATPA